MKNANQICQLLKVMVRISNTEPRSVADTVYGDLAAKALALLPCERCGGTNGIHKQVDDPQAGNSHMLTKMQCPLDPKNPTYY